MRSATPLAGRFCQALDESPVAGGAIWFRQIHCVSWLEVLGFCGFGEAQGWLDGGRRIAMDGELPLNTHGGQLSEGHLHEFGFIYEVVLRLRHQPGSRQVKNAGTAVVSTGGGVPSSVMLLQRAT